MGSKILRLMLISVIAVHYSFCPKSLLADDVSPLSGTKQQSPYSPLFGYSDPVLARLLDVGASSGPSDSDVSFVPPLDGTAEPTTLRLSEYSMQFVLFDLELVKLKAVDPVGGTFTAQLQMVLHWMEPIGPGSDGGAVADSSSCSFLCDTTSPGSRCCDQIWVPSLPLVPGCNTNAIHSIFPYPSVYYRPSVDQRPSTLADCLSTQYQFECSWRRLWYLNIDATCTGNMDFLKFPYDVQELTIDVLNPYASRTWLQLNRGFLKDNVGKGIDGVDLSPDHQIPGWYIEDLMVSCGKLQTWQQTFLAQDDLLWELSGKQGYTKQQDHIRKAFANLECAQMKNLDVADSGALINPENTQPYTKAYDGFKSRFNATLELYTECVRSNGQDFYLNSSLKPNGLNPLRSGGSFNLSQANLNRTFGLLDLHLLKEQPTKVWLPCAIKAVANLTTPGIRITILVHRYSTFYVVKLILPTIACVLFAFSSFGLPVDDLLGRLTVVVPSAIALTALQGLVVSTDIPAVTYITPTTYIILYSYLAQLLIAFESIGVKCWISKRSEIIRRSCCMGTRRADQHEAGELSTEMQSHDVSCYMCTRPADQHLNNDSTDPKSKNIETFDFIFMVGLIFLYIIAIVYFIVIPWVGSGKQISKELNSGGVSMWQNDTSGQ